MNDVSLLRLYVLRATYLLIAVGLGFTIWPDLIERPEQLHLMSGVVHSLLAAVSILAVFGLRYPLQMLPLLLFELIWKSIWCLVFALPMWLQGTIDPVTMETVKACLMGVILMPIVIPWPYVFRTYLAQPGERWL